MSTVRNVVLISIVVILLGSLMVPVISDAAENSVVDVIIVDGQSNAEDWGSFSTQINDLYTETPVKALYYYGSPTTTTHYSDSSAVSATYGLQPMYKEDKWVIGGYGPALCNEYAAKTGHEVCYINIGYSGQSIQTLAPNGSVGTWGFKILGDALNLIKSKYDDVNVLGWIWAQGEADKEMAVATYTQYFEAVQAKFSEYGANKCYIVHTREYYGGNATTAQAQIAEDDPNVTMTCMFTEDFTVANGELRDDGAIHYSQKGRIIIAEELAKVIPKSPNGAQFSLYYAIPVVVIAALLVGVVGMFVVRRND